MHFDLKQKVDSFQSCLMLTCDHVSWCNLERYHRHILHLSVDNSLQTCLAVVVCVTLRQSRYYVCVCIVLALQNTVHS